MPKITESDKRIINRILTRIIKRCVNLNEKQQNTVNELSYHLSAIKSQKLVNVDNETKKSLLALALITNTTIEYSDLFSCTLYHHLDYVKQPRVRLGYLPPGISVYDAPFELFCGNIGSVSENTESDDEENKVRNLKTINLYTKLSCDLCGEIIVKGASYYFILAAHVLSSEHIGNEIKKYGKWPSPFANKIIDGTATPDIVQDDNCTFKLSFS